MWAPWPGAPCQRRLERCDRGHAEQHPDREIDGGMLGIDDQDEAERGEERARPRTRARAPATAGTGQDRLGRQSITRRGS